MATLYVTEYSGAMSGPVPVVNCPPITQNNISMSGSSAQSNAFSPNTSIIRVHADAICSILIGANPTAATTSARMPADSTEYFAVRPGDKIAGITNT